MFGPRLNPHPATLVLGLGKSGLAMARWCARAGCRLRIADTRATPPELAQVHIIQAGQGQQSPRSQRAPLDAEFKSGAFTPALLDSMELVALSPGLSPRSPMLLAIRRAAARAGIPLWGELEFFAQALSTLRRNGYAPRVLAITGTNGKTTTTMLTALLCRHAGKKVAIAGNIGPTLLDTLSDALDSGARLPDIWVLEVSSFQLAASTTFAPDAATILNLAPDHLDWHGGFDAYIAAKRRIFAAHTTRVLNRDDKLTMCLGHLGETPRTLPEDRSSMANPARLGRSDTITAIRALARRPQPRCLTFGLDAAGDYGLLPTDNGIWLARAERCALVPLIPINALRIRGPHNVANALAALALTRAIDLPCERLLKGLREYGGEPHRNQWVATINNVDYIDDSKATNVAATAAALNVTVFECVQKKIVLILGGDGKGQNFVSLAAPVTQAARAVILIGHAAAALGAALSAAGVPIYTAPTLEDATTLAALLAVPGDAVLLSPACASFDMFRDYRHRAEAFRRTVRHIAMNFAKMQT